MLLMVLERHARNSEQLAWVRELLERYEGPLLHYAQDLVGDEARARDVVQDTFLKLLQQQREAIQSEGPWLFRVCRNRALDVLKKERRVKGEEALGAPSSAEPGPAAAVEASELEERMLALVEELPTSQREVLLLKFNYGYSYRRIAEITSLSVSNVGYLLHTAIRKLRAQLHPASA